jgi:hypothetical protein
MLFTYSLIFLQTINFLFKSHLSLGAVFKKQLSKQLKIIILIIDKDRFHKFMHVAVILYLLVYIITEVMFLMLKFFGHIGPDMLKN